jgi:hypothetical protein
VAIQPDQFLGRLRLDTAFLAIRVSISRSPSPLSRRTIERSAALASIVDASTPIRLSLIKPCSHRRSNTQVNTWS